MTRRTAQLDLFDQRQGDLFAPIAQPAIGTARERAAARLTLPGLRRDRLPDWRQESDRLHKLARAAAERARSAGSIELLTWGAGSGLQSGDHMRGGKPGFLMEIFEDGGTWFLRDQLQHANGGSGGPFHMIEATSRIEAVVLAMRQIVTRCASIVANRGENEKGARQMGMAAAALCPPLVYGVDLAQEFAQLEAQGREEAERRARAYRAQHEAERAMQTVLSDAGVWGYPSLIQDKDAVENLQEDHYAATFVADYFVTGAAEALEVVIYPRQTAREGYLEPYRAAMAAAVTWPVRFARPEEHPLSHSDRARLSW